MFESFAEFIVSFFPITGRLASVFEYWIYNNIKILFILTLVVFFVAFLRTYFPPEKIRDYLKGKNSIIGYLFAVILGIISPFCTCSTIPIFLGLVAAGIPFGIIITFLFVSPMINLAAIIVLLSTLGWQITLSYLVGGTIVAILGAVILSKLGMERFLFNFGVNNVTTSEIKLNWRQRINKTYSEGIEIIKEIFPYVLLGVTVGAGIHGLVPEDLVGQYLTGAFSVPGAVLIGVPIYTDILGVIPIAETLINKGLPIGTAVAFMMSVAALSFPQFILLKKAMQKKLLFYYGLILTLGIIILGFLLNLFFV